jgi:hypothetical protein
MGRHGDERGVVMAVRGGRAVVLSPDGAFRRLRADAAWRVGDEVALTPARTRPRLVPALGSLAGAALAAAMAFTYLSVQSARTPAVYVEIAGNEPVKLAVNASGQVLTATALQGSTLPAAVRPGEPVSQAVVALARAEGVAAGGVEVGGVVVMVYRAKGANPPVDMARVVEAAAGRAGAVTVSDVVPAPAKTTKNAKRHAAAAEGQGVAATDATAVGPSAGSGPAST